VLLVASGQSSNQDARTCPEEGHIMGPKFF
jgi:hypothetical protein